MSRHQPPTSSPQTSPGTAGTPPALQLLPNPGAASSETSPNAPPIPHHRVLQVRPWDDSQWHHAGHDPRSAYVERFGVAVLGPSVVWFLRLVAREFDHLAAGQELRLDLELTARRLGLQHRGGRQSTLMRTIDRCRTFDLARLEDDCVLGVRRRLPPVPQRLRLRMPPELRDEANCWSRTEGRSDFSLGETRLLASCMLMLGHGLHESAERLVMLGLAPRAANEATAWAWSEQSVHPANDSGDGWHGPRSVHSVPKKGHHAQDHQPQTNSTSVRTPKPVAPRENSPSSASVRTGPAMSR